MNEIYNSHIKILVDLNFKKYLNNDTYVFYNHIFNNKYKIIVDFNDKSIKVSLTSNIAEFQFDENNFMHKLNKALYPEETYIHGILTGVNYATS